MKGLLVAAGLAAGIVSTPAAHADVFTMCPSGHAGVVGGRTTCAFAENVSRAFYASGMAPQVIAYSPVTGQRYVMTCSGRKPALFDDGSWLVSTNCYGGDGAAVVLW